MARLKTLFHIDEMEKWSLLLINVRNTLIYCGDENVDIEVVANSEAVDGYKPDFELAHVITKQSSRGVKFVACKNALDAHKMGKEDILNFVQVVPASIVEIVEKQQEGYGYIKP